MKKPVFVVDGSRTPFLKMRGTPGPFSAADLAVSAGRPLLLRQPFKATDLDEVILGCTIPSPDEANIARIVGLRLGCGHKISAWTVQRNCASGMQAVDSACYRIQNGDANLILAGGTEVMSRSPLLWDASLVAWFANLTRQRSLVKKLAAVSRLKFASLKPIIGLLRGLTDPVIGLNMGQTAEVIAHRFKVSREQMDVFALKSHQKLAAAQQAGRLNAEITPIYDNQGNPYEHDDGVRPDSSLLKLSQLKPVFEKKLGHVTAGNSAQITDGAACLILASEEAVEKYQLSVLGCITDSQWSGLDPEHMGLGPIHAMTPLLQRNNLSPDDIDYWEVNEAFAAQVLACIHAWKDPLYCQQSLNQLGAIGKIPKDRLNVNGGSIAIGHPIGASGARIILHLLHTLKQNQATRGIASLCIGGGQGGAMLLERTAS